MLLALLVDFFPFEFVVDSESDKVKSISIGAGVAELEIDFRLEPLAPGVPAPPFLFALPLEDGAYECLSPDATPTPGVPPDMFRPVGIFGLMGGVVLGC